MASQCHNRRSMQCRPLQRHQISHLLMAKLLLLLWVLSPHFYYCQCLTIPNLALQVAAATPAPYFSLGPIRLWPGKHAFSWEASVDSSTGIATSREVSIVPPRSFLQRQFQNTPATEIGEREVWTQIVQRLQGYPQWLVRGAVTFGLFRAVPGYNNNNSYSLQDRFLGINFLTFGPPQSQRFSMFKTVPIQDYNGATRMMPARVGDCIITLPIQGGLLALQKPNRRDKACLRFTLQHNAGSQETKLITEIRGYSPMLVGRKEPVPFYRKWGYLSTQSLIHANAMWRFHRYCKYSTNTLPVDKKNTRRTKL